ncbi:MAG: hypothetical protein B6U77_00330 [Candidatus Hecatellales archaeon ex4484_218]|nr:MAG: hypothetical protein B6U77_00330 [Candidatus Hecatellales archaeon ex4484_218]
MEKNFAKNFFQEKVEKLTLILEKLAEKSSEGAIILVEGVKDVEALKNIGIKGKICCIKNRKIPLYDFLSQYIDIDEEVIVLTDFDRRGTQLAEKIVNYLEKSGKPVNLTFWLKMQNLFSSSLKDIEGVASYLKNIERKAYKHPFFG